MIIAWLPLGVKTPDPWKFRPSVNLTGENLSSTICVITYLTHHVTYSRRDLVTWPEAFGPFHKKIFDESGRQVITAYLYVSRHTYALLYYHAFVGLILVKTAPHELARLKSVVERERIVTWTACAVKKQFYAVRVRCLHASTYLLVSHVTERHQQRTDRRYTRSLSASTYVWTTVKYMLCRASCLSDATYFSSYGHVSDNSSAETRQRQITVSKLAEHRASGVVAQALWPPIVENFFCILLPGQGHDSLKFSNRNLAKNFGKKNSPQGGLTPKILEKWIVSPRVTCLQICIRYL